MTQFHTIVPKDAWHGFGAALHVETTNKNGFNGWVDCPDGVSNGITHPKLKVRVEFLASQTTKGSWSATCIQTGTTVSGSSDYDALTKCIERLLVTLARSQVKKPNTAFTDYFKRKGIQVIHSPS